MKRPKLFFADLLFWLILLLTAGLCQAASPPELLEEEKRGADVFVTSRAALLRETAAPAGKIVARLPYATRLTLLEGADAYLHVEVPSDSPAVAADRRPDPRAQSVSANARRGLARARRRAPPPGGKPGSSSRARARRGRHCPRGRRRSFSRGGGSHRAREGRGRQATLPLHGRFLSARTRSDRQAGPEIGQLLARTRARGSSPVSLPCALRYLYGALAGDRGLARADRDGSNAVGLASFRGAPGRLGASARPVPGRGRQARQSLESRATRSGGLRTRCGHSSGFLRRAD